MIYTRFFNVWIWGFIVFKQFLRIKFSAYPLNYYILLCLL